MIDEPTVLDSPAPGGTEAPNADALPRLPGSLAATSASMVLDGSARMVVAVFFGKGYSRAQRRLSIMKIRKQFPEAQVVAVKGGKA